VGSCPCEPISGIKIVAVQFLSDHGVLKDYNAGWDGLGAPFPRTAWMPSTQHPVSHTMDMPVRIKVTIDVSPLNACPETGSLRGEGPGGLVFEKSPHTFQPGWQTITLDSDRNLPKEVQVLDFRIRWTAQGISASISPSETANTMYVTYDTPYNDTPYENEVTEKRLKWVCSLCASQSNGHDSVKKIHDSTGSYDLNSSTPSPLWNIAGGAHAQCMDLSSFYMLAAEMLGLKTGQVVYIYPKPGKTVKESTSGTDNETRPVATPPHPAKTTHKVINPNEEVLMRDYSGGPNNYEACYKFTHPDTSGALKTRYYAGGADIYDTAEDVMKAVCKETHWVFETAPGDWSICTNPGPSPIDKWGP
jgi:hypothetical protein